MQIKINKCDECRYEKPITNKKYNLCNECNYIRLHGETRESSYNKKQFYQNSNRKIDNDRFGWERESENSETLEELTPYEKYKNKFKQRRDIKKEDRRRCEEMGKSIKKIQEMGQNDDRNVSRNPYYNSTIKNKTKNSNLPNLKIKYSIKQISNKNKYECSDGTKVIEVQIKRKYAEVCDKIDIEREPVCSGCLRGDKPLSHSHTISRPDCKNLHKTELIWDENNIEFECYEERGSNPTCCHNIWEDSNWMQKKKLLNFDKKVKFIKLHDIESYNKIPKEFINE